MNHEEQAENVVQSWQHSSWTCIDHDRRNLVNLIASAISAAVQDDRNRRATVCTQEAVLREREACAMIATDFGSMECCRETADQIADTIRARSGKPT